MVNVLAWAPAATSFVVFGVAVVAVVVDDDIVAEGGGGGGGRGVSTDALGTAVSSFTSVVLLLWKHQHQCCWL